MKFDTETTIYTVEQAYKLVKANHDIKYKWYCAKNKFGNIMELGGRAKEGEFKASVPRYKNGEPVIRENGFIESHYYLAIYIHPEDGISYDNEKQILHDCINHNFTEGKPDVEQEYEVIVERNLIKNKRKYV